MSQYIRHYISPGTCQSCYDVVTRDIVVVGVRQAQLQLPLVMQANLSQQQAQLSRAGDVLWNIKHQTLGSLRRNEERDDLCQ